MSTKNRSQRLATTRRETLIFLGAAGVTAFVGCGGDANPLDPPGTCVVKPGQADGPYFVDERLNRSDIRSDPTDNSVKAGALLKLSFGVSRVKDGACVPLKGATVDIWHCDALGVYSDVADVFGQYNTMGKKFLRGYQVTNDSGVAEFVTIYPGWYTVRSVHIHFKIRTDPSAGPAHEFTSQLYFDDSLSDQVFQLSPYNTRGPRNTRNNIDNLYAQGGDQLLLKPVMTAQGYEATFEIGLDLS